MNWRAYSIVCGKVGDGASGWGLPSVWGFLSVSEKDDGLNLCVSRNVSERPPIKDFHIRVRLKRNGKVILVTQNSNCAPQKDASSNDCC